MRKGFLLSLFCCLSSIASFATNYYYQGGTFTTAANWNDNPAGGGGTPADFTNAADVWVVTTTTPLAINAAWTVAGSLQIDGTCTITVANPAISGGITVNSGGTLNQNLASTAVSPIMASVQNGTVSYGTGTHTIPAGITFQNLTLGTTAGTCTASGDITVNGTLLVNSGRTLDMSVNQLIAGGSFVVSSTGTINTANSSSQPIPSGYAYTTTVNYNGTGAQTVVAGTYTSLTISGARGGADITFASGTVRVGTGTAGTLTLSATGVGNYITTGNTFVYGDTNGGMTVASAIPYNNLTFLNTSGSQTAGGNITVNGALTTTAGGTFSLSTFQLLGTFTVTNAGTIGSSNTSSNPFPSGVNWGSAGTVSYSAAGATTIVTGTYFNMTITGNKALANITFEPGTFVLGGTTFTGSATNVGGYVTTGTTINFSRAAGGATLFALAIPYQNLTFSNTSGTYTAGANLTVNGTLTTTAGGTLALSTLQLLGTPTIVNGGTITTINTSATPIPSGLNWGTTGTVSFAVNSAQTVPGGTYNNLSFTQSTTTATAAGDITVNGTLTTTTGATGSFDLSTFQLIAGTSFAVANNGTIKTSNTSSNPVPSGYSWSGTTGGFEYKGTGAQTIVTGTYKTLTLSGDHGGAAITLESGTINLTGNFSVTATNIGSYTTTGNTFRYTTLTGAQTVGGITYNNLTFLNTSATNTAGGNVTVNGTLTTTLGGTFSLGTNQLLGTPTISNAGTITTLNTGSNPLPSGLDWGSSGTVSYSAAGATTIVAGTYNNMTITGNKATAAITFESGNIVLNGSTLTGSATNVGSYVNTGNTVIFNRTAGAVTLFAMPITYNNVTFANTSGTYSVSASGPMTVNGTLTTTSGGTLALQTAQLLGTPTIVNGGTISTTNTTATPVPSGIDWGTAGTVNFATTTGTGQTVPGGTYNNLLLSQTASSVTATAAGDITVNGTLTTTTGTSYFDLSTFNLIAGTSFTVVNNGSIKTSSSSATPLPSGYNWAGTTGGFEYRGTGAQTIVAGTYKALTLSGNHGAANITLESGTIDLTGNFTFSATNIGGYTTTGNTFRYTTLTGAQTIGAITYNNLTMLNTSGTNTAAAAVTVNGMLTTTGGGTMAMSTFQLLGTPAITNNGTITTANTGSNPLPSGLDWAANGGTGTVSYGGTTTATIVTGTYYNLTTTGAHAANAVTLESGDIYVNNTLAWGASSTNFVNTGNTVTLNNAAGNGSNINSTSLTLNNLTLNNTSSSYKAGAALVINGTLTTTAGGTLDMQTNTLTGTLSSIVNNGTVRTSSTSNPPFVAGKNWGSAGAVVFAVAAGGQSVPAGTFHDLTFLNSSGTNTVVGSFAVNGTLTTTAGGTLSMQTNQMTGTPTAVHMGTLTTANTGSNPLPSGVNWTNGGGTGTISYGGTTTFTIVTGTYYNLTTTGAHVANTLTLESGDIVVNNTLNWGASSTSFANTGNTLILNNAAGNGANINSTALTLNNLTLNNTSSSYKAGAGLVVNGTLTTTAGGTLDMQTSQLTGTLGTIANGGTIRTSSTSVPAFPSGKTWNGLVVIAATAGAQSIPAGTFNDLTFLNTSATNTVTGTITVNGTLTTTAGGAVSMGTNQLLGTPTLAHFGTISTANTGSNPFPSGLDWTTGGGTGTVSFGGTTTATIVTGTYYNLTTTGAHVANALTLASGTITVNNNLTWGASSTNFVTTGNTLILNNASGSGSNINSTALTTNNLTLNNTSGNYTAGAGLTVNGVLTSTAGGTLVMGTNALALGGSASNSGTGTITTANTTATPITASKTWTQTVEFNSASGQTIVAGSFGNLVLSNAGTKTASGAVTVTGDLTIGSSNTLADGGNTITVTGDILGTGTHTGGGKIVMNGASSTISGVTLQNLQLNNAAGFGLTGDLTVNGTLTFTAGILDPGANNITFGSTAATATPSSSSMIASSSTGEIRKKYTANGSFTFPVGDNVGPNYSPISLNFTGGTYGGGAYAAVTVTKSVQPQNTSGTDYLNRYWSVNTSNITSPVYTVSATYVPGDVSGTESLIYMGEYSSATWTQHMVTNTSTHTLTTNANVTATSADFTGVGGPGVSVTTGTVCPTGTATLTATGSGVFSPFTYTWAPATNLSATTGASVQASPTVTTVYTVTATDGHGLTGIGTTTVTVVSQPSVNIGLSASGYICPTTVMTLTATPSGGTGTADYKWSGPGISGSPSSAAVPSYTAIPTPSYTLIPTTAPGSYTVVLTYSGSGCQSVAATSSSITPAVHQWEGGASGDVNNWSNASNWVCGGVPAASDHILIPARSNQPTIMASTTSSIARLYMNSGTTLTMGASATLNVSGNFTNNGTITGPSTANVVLNGSSAQTLSGAGNVYNLELNNSTGATLGGASTDTLTVKGTLTLTSGTLTTNGKLMLYADATTNGRIGEITGGALSGNIVSQMWIQTVGHPAWHFFSHPFDNYIAMNMLINSIDMTGSGGPSNGWVYAPSNNASSYWIDPNTGWVPFTNANANTAANQFKRHQGIRMYVWGNKNEVIWGGSTSTSVRMRLYGHPNTGVQNVTMSKATTDYNQVGNPYPSPVNIGQVVKDASDAGKLVGTTYWVWDPSLGTTGQYVAKNIDGSAFYIASGNAFQLRTAVDGNTLIFNEAHKGTTPSNSLRKYSDRINLTVYDATYHPWDMLSVKFDQESTEAEESADGGKPDGPADLNFYSVSSDNVKLSSDVRPYAAGKVIPLGINSNVKSQFILKADNVTVPTGARVYLHDKLLNKYQLLTQGSEYPFSINENGMSQGDNRFELTMEELHAFDLHTNVTLEASLAPNPAVSEVAISYNTSGAENTTISVADVSGHVIFTKDAGTARNGKVIVPLSQFAAGVYLVTISSGDAKIERTLIKE